MELYSILGKVLYIESRLGRACSTCVIGGDSRLLGYQYAHNRDRIFLMSVLSTTSREVSIQNIDFFERI